MTKFTKIFTPFKQWLTNDTVFSAVTIEHYLRITKNFLNYLDSLRLARLNDVDAELVKQFAYFNTEKKRYAPASINVRLGALNCFFSWAYEHRFCRENPLLSYKKAQIKPKPLTKKEGRAITHTPVILSFAQQEKLYKLPLEKDFIAIRNLCIVLLILSSALFIEEVIDLSPEMLSFNNRLIVLKGDIPRKRKTPMNTQCYKACKKWLAIRQKLLDDTNSPFLFFTQQFKPLTRRHLYHIVADTLTAAGIQLEHMGPEVLRQTAICNLLKHYLIGDVKEFTGISFEQLEKYQALINSNV